jgi:peptide/nickel transport system permease protein
MRLVASRLVQTIPVLLGVTLVSFLLLRLSGDPAQIYLPLEATAQEREAFRRAFGLDQPLPVQYVSFLAQAVCGNFGESFRYREPALGVVVGHLPSTLQLAVAAMLLGLLVAIPAGVAASVWRNSPIERLVMGVALLGQSIPTYWLGMMLILLFAVTLRWLPVSGQGSLQHLVLPVCTLALWVVALIARLTRSEMIGVLANDYIRTARAKGLRNRRVLFGHALRNALIPLVAMVALQFAGLIGGAVLTEIVFAWPGVGTLVMESVLRRDYPVVMAALTVVALGFVIVNLVADILYGYLDPRIRV